MLIAGTNYLTKRFTDVCLTIGNVTIHQSKSIRNLGVLFDGQLTMSDQVPATCRSVNYNLINVYQIRRYIDVPTCKDVVRCLILSRL